MHDSRSIELDKTLPRSFEDHETARSGDLDVLDVRKACPSGQELSFSRVSGDLTEAFSTRERDDRNLSSGLRRGRGNNRKARHQKSPNRYPSRGRADGPLFPRRPRLTGKRRRMKSEEGDPTPPTTPTRSAPPGHRSQLKGAESILRGGPLRTDPDRMTP